MTYGPDGLARDPQGKAVFVSGGVIGDVVEARVVEDGASFSRAAVEEVLEPSPSRRQAPCPFVGVCGGCPWGSMSREAQLAAKKRTCALRWAGSAASRRKKSIIWSNPSALPRTNGVTATRSSSPPSTKTENSLWACTGATRSRSSAWTNAPCSEKEVPQGAQGRDRCP